MRIDEVIGFPFQGDDFPAKFIGIAERSASAGLSCFDIWFVHSGRAKILRSYRQRDIAERFAANEADRFGVSIVRSMGGAE